MMILWQLPDIRVVAFFAIGVKVSPLYRRGRLNVIEVNEDDELILSRIAERI